MLMRVSYSVTFEFPTRAPMTHRGTVKGGRAASLAARAIRQATKALRPQGWSSLVVVLLDRVWEQLMRHQIVTTPEPIDPILTASEAVYAFAGWLNVYDIVTDGVGLSEAVHVFCRALPSGGTATGLLPLDQKTSAPAH